MLAVQAVRDREEKKRRELQERKEDLDFKIQRYQKHVDVLEDDYRNFDYSI